MSADLADFGHDYRSVNLQCSSAYLLDRNGNLFDSRVPASMLLGSRLGMGGTQNFVHGIYREKIPRYRVYRGTCFVVVD